MPRLSTQDVRMSLVSTFEIGDVAECINDGLSLQKTAIGKRGIVSAIETASINTLPPKWISLKSTPKYDPNMMVAYCITYLDGGQDWYGSVQLDRYWKKI